MSPRLVASLQTLGAVYATVLAAVLAKIALREVAPFTFVWLQLAVAGTALGIFTFGLRRERVPRGIGWRIWLYLAGIGICNFTLVRLATIFALERLPATTHAYLLGFVGIVTMGMSVLFLGERPSVVQLLGALLAIVGLRVFFREAPPPAELTGALYAALAVVGLAAYNTFARKLAVVNDGAISNNVVSTLALWIGGGPVVAVGLWGDWPPEVHAWQNWGIIFVNGIVGVAIALTVFNYILRTLRSYEASLLASSGIIFMALTAYVVLDERLDGYQLVGIAMMLAGLGIVQIRRGSGA